MDPGPCTAAIATRSISQPVHPGRPEDTDRFDHFLIDLFNQDQSVPQLADQMNVGPKGPAIF
jgi:hypothetical protein